MVKNCFNCTKNANCIEFQVCDKASHWQGDEPKSIIKCETCDNCDILTGNCKKFVYPRSKCINKKYFYWEVKK